MSVAAPLVRRELRITLGLRRPFRLSHRVRPGVAGRAAVSCVSLAAPSKIPEVEERLHQVQLSWALRSPAAASTVRRDPGCTGARSHTHFDGAFWPHPGLG